MNGFLIFFGTNFSHTVYALLFIIYEWTPFVDAFFMQQLAETVQLNSKLTVFYYNSVLIIMLCIWHFES